MGTTPSQKVYFSSGFESEISFILRLSLYTLTLIPYKYILHIFYSSSFSLLVSLNATKIKISSLGYLHEWCLNWVIQKTFFLILIPSISHYVIIINYWGIHMYWHYTYFIIVSCKEWIFLYKKFRPFKKNIKLNFRIKVVYTVSIKTPTNSLTPMFLIWYLICQNLFRCQYI